MSLEDEQKHLQMANDHIAAAERHIRRQMEIIVEMETDHHEAAAVRAVDLLAIMEGTLAAMVAHRKQVTEHIDRINKGRQ